MCLMADRPILFSGPMVRAILAGAKCQTRRLIKGAPVIHPRGTPTWYPSPEHRSRLAYDGPEHFARGVPQDFAPWRAGDTLWVRETWCAISTPDQPGGGACLYRADDGPSERAITESRAWRPSIFMPRWASRISLRVTSVRAERLGEISGADAEAEGATHVLPNPPDSVLRLSALARFRVLWGFVHGEGAWERDQDQWVWVVSFGAAEVAHG